jgi:hypothetical protein
MRRFTPALIVAAPEGVSCDSDSDDASDGLLGNAPVVGKLPELGGVLYQLYLICSATPMIDTTQMPVTNNVSRSRFFSTTVEPDRLD